MSEIFDPIITLQGVPLPCDRNEALAYYERYRTIVNGIRQRRPDVDPPYERADYIKFIVAMYGERKDRIEWPAFKTGQGR